MRTAVLLVFLASPALAWENRVESGNCVLSHNAETLALELTYDPVQPLYTIALTQTASWPEAPVFSIRFDGSRSLTISTTRQMLDLDATRLSVSDTGFGNVLDGLEFNDVAVMATGDAEIRLDLDGAAPAIRDFRACIAAPVA